LKMQKDKPALKLHGAIIKSYWWVQVVEFVLIYFYFWELII